ncbi:SDR family NAD(P)-dependent oxidoreductase [Vibrio parahaemolyticus]
MNKTIPTFKKKKLMWNQEEVVEGIPVFDNGPTETGRKEETKLSERTLTNETEEKDIYRLTKVAWKGNGREIQKSTLCVSRGVIRPELPESWDYARISDLTHTQLTLEEFSPDRLVLLSDGTQGSVSLLISALQSLISLSRTGKTEVVIIREDDSFEDGGLLGVSRTAKIEYPELSISNITLAGSNFETAFQACNNISTDTELYIGVDGETSEFVLDRSNEVASPSKKNIRKEASYVISGGVGALGLEAAELLVENGARQILLLTRTDYTVNEKPGKLKELEKKADIRCVCCDVSSMLSLRRAIRLEKGLLEIAGIVHTAGILTDGTLPNQSGDLLEKGFDVKVVGALNLEAVCRPTDFFIMYSSVAGALGSLGQASYSAANSAMDSLANAWSKTQNFQVLSVQWGPWDEVGMAANSGALERSRASGFLPISPTDGKAYLKTALEKNLTGVAMICPVHWGSVSLQSPLIRKMSELYGRVQGQAETKTTESWPGDYEERVRNVVRKAVWESIGEPVPDSVPLQENGLNSLGSMSLRNMISTNLNISLPSAFVAECPDINAMVSFIVVSSAPSQPLVREEAPVSKYPVLVVGGGLGGLTFAHQLDRLNVPVRVMEKSPSVGGVWNRVANTDSKLQIDSPAYDFDNSYLPINGDKAWGESFPNQSQILTGARELVENLGDKVEFNTEVVSVKEIGSQEYRVTYHRNGELREELYSGVVSMTGGLHVPRKTPLANENDFEGHIGLGISNDTSLDKYKGADVVIVGHGAFALENMRTALENGANHVTILCRRRNLVLSTFCNWMLNSNDGVMSVTEVMEIMRPFYAACGVDVEKLPSFVRDEAGELLLDQTTVPPGSDLFFLAQMAGKLTIIESEISEFKANSVLTKESLEIPADIVLKCFGFKTEDKLLKNIFGDDMSIEGFWINGDPNLFTYNDGAQVPRKVKSLLCSSYLFFVQCFAKAYVHFRQDPKQFTEAHKRITSTASSISVAERIFIEVWDIIEPAKRNLAQRTRERLPFERFQVEREQEWRNYAELLGVSDGKTKEMWDLLNPTIAIKSRREPESPAEVRLDDTKYGDFSVFKTKRKSVLFLPGQGTDARLARSLLERTGWLQRTELDFTIVDAPFVLPAFTNETQLQQVGLDGLVELGIYNREASYREWRAGFETLWDEFHGKEVIESTAQQRADWIYSLGYLKKVIDEFGPFDGIAGFCEGSAVLSAALALEQRGADYGLSNIKFFIAMSPWLPPLYLKDGLFEESSPIQVPTLQIIGDNDMPVFIEAAPRFAKSFSDRVEYHHSGQHVYPPLTKPLANKLDELLNISL